MTIPVGPQKPPDLVQIEQVALDLSIDSIREFASHHKDKRFYAFGLDINAEYGDLLLCLSTEDHFRETSKRYIAKWNYGEAELARLRRNFGDWKYQGFNLEQSSWDLRWKPFREAIETYVFSPVRDDEDEDLAYERNRDFVESTMKCFCRVLIRIERSGILGEIARDPDFFTQVRDHDETEDDALNRLSAVRKQMSQS